MIDLLDLDLPPFEDHEDWGREVVVIGDRDYVFRWDRAGDGRISIEFEDFRRWETDSMMLRFRQDEYPLFVAAIQKMAGKAWSRE